MSVCAYMCDVCVFMLERARVRVCAQHLLNLASLESRCPPLLSLVIRLMAVARLIVFGRTPACRAVSNCASTCCTEEHADRLLLSLKCAGVALPGLLGLGWDALDATAVKIFFLSMLRVLSARQPAPWPPPCGGCRPGRQKRTCTREALAQATGGRGAERALRATVACTGPRRRSTNIAQAACVCVLEGDSCCAGLSLWGVVVDCGGLPGVVVGCYNHDFIISPGDNVVVVLKVERHREREREH